MKKPVDQIQPFDLALLSNPDGDGPRRNAEWSRLHNTMTPRLLGFFKRWVEDDDALDDLVSGIWRKALPRLATLKAPEALWSWLLRIGENLLRDQWRAQKRHYTSLGHQLQVDGMEESDVILGWVAGDVLDAVISKEDVARVRRCVDDEDWEILRLWAVEGLTHPEIANRARLASAEACRQRVSRLCARLRRKLGDSAAEEI